ncbi:MAG: TonB-dependent receptor [Lautropia sp.]
MLVPISVGAQAVDPPTASEAREERSLGVVDVRDTRIDPNPNAETGAPFKARTSGDARHTRPLAETPRTTTVVTREAIDASGVDDLRLLLDAQPGITLGTGENGNQFGDRYIIRGQEARSDVFVDGLRDPGMTIRESFAVEQLEISKGPNSSFAGRGTAGGAINAITKQATLDYDFTRVSVGVGTDRHVRLTADANRIFTDAFALRVNALYGTEDVPGRSPADRRRTGLALSGAYEFTRDLTLTLDYYGLRAKDSPDLGSYLVGTVPNRRPDDRAPVYLQDPDFQRSDVDTLTARLVWRIRPTLKLTSLTRYGIVDNGYIVTGARLGNAFGAAGTYPAVALSTHQGWQDVNYFAHQSNLQWDKTLGGMKHTFIVGAEYSDHKVLKGVWDIANTGAFNCRTQANAATNNGYCATDAAGNVVAGLQDLLGRRYERGTWNADWRVKTVSVYAMDTVDLTKNLTAFGGIRADRFDFTLGTQNVNTGALASYDYTDTLVNGHLGLSYKLSPRGMVYASVATASDINGGESDVGTNSGYGGAVIYDGSIAGAKPEDSTNLEIGTKWNLNDEKLLLTAAVFQSTKRNVMEGANYDAVGTFNTGRNRVQGIELGLAGNLTRKLSGQLGMTVMRAEVLDSATPANVGRPLSNFAKRSGVAILKYQLTPAFSFGGVARYESGRCAGQPDTAAGFTAEGLCAQPVPSYVAYDAFASYRFNRKVDLRLNVLNLTDKDYYLAAYRSGSFLYKGDARAARLTLNVAF